MKRVSKNALKCASLLSLSLAASGCVSRKSSKSSTKNAINETNSSVTVQGAITEPAECEPGLNYVGFALGSDLTDESGVQKKFENAKIIKADAKNNVRVDICTNFDTAVTKITGVAIKYEDQNINTMLSSGEILKQEGLSEGIFGNTAATHFVARLPNEMFLHIIGGVEYGELDVAISKSETDATDLASKLVMFGNFRGGFDPFPSASNVCAQFDTGKKIVDRTVQLGTASVKITTCEGAAGSSGTHAHSYIGFEVSDSNPMLGSNANKPFVVSVEQIAKGKISDGNLAVIPANPPHHNDCESFGIVLPHAKYFVTNLGSTGQYQKSCSTLDDAPKLLLGSTKALFTIKYGSDPASQPASAPFSNWWDE